MPVPHGAVLPPLRHADRRDRLRGRLADVGCEALVVTDPVDVRYLSGFDGSNGVLVVGADAAADLFISDSRYRERVQGLDVPHVELQHRLEAVVARLGRLPLGVDADHVTLAQAARLESARDGEPLVRTSGLVASLRVTKDAEEVARLRHACTITADVLRDLLEDGPRPGATERELARAVEREFLERGADGVAFATIVASGVNGASPHHDAGERRLRPGDLVTVDAGAEVDGYRADMTRTFVVAGSAPEPRLREVHAVVLAANEAGRRAARPHGEVAAVDRSARRVVVEAGYGDAFVHPTGHGIGLAVHEAPLVTERSAASLHPGTTFTVEPGIYLPGLGGVRIEDSLVVFEDEVDVMTELERGLTPA